MPDSLGKHSHDLEGQIKDKELAVKMRQEQVDGVKAQTGQYRQQLANRQTEMDDARKEHSNGGYLLYSPTIPSTLLFIA